MPFGHDVGNSAESRTPARQSQSMSLVEATTNVVVGYVVAVATQLVLFPLLGLSVMMQDNLIIGSIFTAVSIGRSYALRRLFEAIHTR
jgi:hypothetical protein